MIKMQSQESKINTPIFGQNLPKLAIVLFPYSIFPWENKRWENDIANISRHTKE